MAKKISFFAEQRQSNANPNFINKIDERMLRSNVKRIVKDIADNFITDEDYMYFKNERVINACIQVSYHNWRLNQTIKNALDTYANVSLPSGYIPPGANIKEEYENLSYLQVDIAGKASVWGSLYRAFNMIKNENADPKYSLYYITTIPKDVIRTL